MPIPYRGLSGTINDEQSRPLKGSQFLDTAEQKLSQGISYLKDASKDREGIGDDLLRLAGGGLKNVGHVANAPVIKQGLQLAGAIPWAAGQAIGAGLEHGLGIDPRYGHIAGELGDIAVGGGALKIGGKLARKGSKAALRKAGDYLHPLVAGMGGTGQAWATAGKADDLLIAAKQARKDLLRPRPKGTKLSSRKAAEEFYGLDGSSAKELGFEFKNKGSSVDPNWGLSNKQLRNRQLSNRNQRILNVTESEEVFNAGKAKMKAIKAKNMEPHHIIPTHVSQKLKDSMSPEDWVKTVKADAKKGIFHGNDPRNLVAARHSTKTPTHSAGKQSKVWHRLGTKDFPGYHNLEGQVKNIEDYYNYRDLMSKNIRNKKGLGKIKKTEPTQWSDFRARNIKRDVELFGQAEWKVGDAKVTWYPNKNNPLKGRGQIDILEQAGKTNPKGVKALIKDFNDSLKDFPSGVQVELNPKWKDAKRRSIYENYIFKNHPNIKRNADPTLGWVYTAP